ncbi:MAG TPA: CHAT domain-containing protein [Vicinamibacteria bacterium]
MTGPLLLAALLLPQSPFPDRPPRCEAFYQEGRRLYFAGLFAEAREGFRAAQGCFHGESGREDTLSQRYEGLCFQYEDRLDEALALFRAAAATIEAESRAALGGQLPEKSSALADARNNVGWALFLKGEYAAARAELERALTLATDGPVERGGNVWVRGRVLTNLAIATAALGDASQAYRTLGEVAATESGDGMNRTRALEHLGRLEESWGDVAAALARYESALQTGEAAMFDSAPVAYNRAYLVGAHSRLGLLRERLGRPREAREAVERGLALARELGTRRLIAQVLLDRGRLQREGGDLAGAARDHEEALALAGEARLEREEALGLAELGWNGLARGDASAALSFFERALASKAVSESPETAGAVRAGLARAREALGQADEAAREDDRAVEAVEAVRRGDLPETRRLGYWRLRQAVFRSAIALRHRLLEVSGELRHAERALELAEQARSRTLLDLIGRGGVPGAPEGVGRALPVERLREEILHGDAALLAFTLDEPRSWAFVLTRRSCAMAALPGRAEIERDVEEWRRQLATAAEAPPSGDAARVSTAEGRGRTSGGRPNPVAARLHAVLLGPFAARVAGHRRLVVVPDGALHALPFEALEDERGRLVLDRHVVSYAPSASVAAALRARRAAGPPASGRLLAFAAPPSPAFGPLPLARTEALAIARLFPDAAAEVREGEAASERWLKQARLSAYGTLHFATHGTYDDRAPGRSALVLAAGRGEDGLLQVGEIASLSLRARLVSLSACDTGLGEVVNGEGVVGLARAFLNAGADAVAMTLWRIPDASTAELMQAFYRHLRGGREGAEALREAKLELRRSRASRRGAFHWAGVVLSGDAFAALPAF